MSHKIAGLAGNRQRVAVFLRDHRDKAYTPKQVAHYLRLSPRTVLRHLEALVVADLVHEVES